ncbi:hypothetical protein [Pyrobaculum calidifontis]|uniref:Glycosyltransferase RgtA/B/C/D-like domain-containing protein n=1 Tax=Pyrobaculum calidifontis (strain DSM 21063 / JCM 11548 / VA1) TaxID=410359 RepID=A3MTD8_PYRCJ|nr:hypothetical protein [Pyrobaculum calidifontis]ABO07905.1 hypothetical protein Pcal_0474 [Pyrobaculum calidifontis JCM 11548]
MRRLALAVAAVAAAAPYLYLYVTAYAKFFAHYRGALIPLGDDYPMHVYFALQFCHDPATVMQGQYPGLLHIAASLPCDLWKTATALSTMAILLIPLAVAAWGLVYRAVGAGKWAWPLAALAVLSQPRLLQSVGDGQLPEKYTLLVILPAAAYLWLRGRRAAAGAVAGLAAWTSYLGATYVALFALATLSPTLAATAAAVAAAGWPRVQTAFTTAAEAAGGPALIPYMDPIRASFYVYFNPIALPALAAAALWLAAKKPRTLPLLATALALWAAAFALPPLNERLARAAGFLLTASTLAAAWEKDRRVLAATALLIAAGPAAAGWAWAAAHIAPVPYGEQLLQYGLFQPAVRTLPCKLDAYQEIAKEIPRGATVSVAWQLDLWLLPYLYQTRPDVKVNVTVCPWDMEGLRVVSGLVPGSWYLPCYSGWPTGPCNVTLVR